MDNIINSLFETKDYDKFKFLKGNRHINTANIKTLEKSISRKYLKVPIIVNNNMEIIDGQHRFTIAKNNNLPVYYIIINDYGRIETEILNTASRKWTPDDYLESYCDLGYINYIKIKDFMNLTSLSLSLSREFFERSTENKIRVEEFKNGEFKPIDEDMAYKMYEWYCDFNNCPAYTNTLFVRSLIRVFRSEGYNHDIMKLKLAHSAYKLKVRSFMSEYLECIEDVYNYKTRQNDRTFFKSK